MGNCQAIDNATLLIQHPSGRVDKMYVPVNATEIMKMNPGHYVALLLTTTYCGAPPAKTTTSATTVTVTTATNNAAKNNNTTNAPVRITRIKLLRPTDTLVLGHVYRLITTQEVMKGLSAKKYAKMRQQHSNMVDKQDNNKLTNSDYEKIARRSLEKTNQARHDRNRIRMAPPANTTAVAAKSRTWHPRLHSISEASS